MSVQRILAFIALGLLAISMTACELPASTPPPATPESDSPLATLQSELRRIGTETAAAAGGVIEATGPPPPVEEDTPEPTPEPVEEQPTEPPPEPVEAPTDTPEVSSPVPAFEPTPGLPSTYQLQRGEFPFCIARRFNVNQNELLSINGLGLNSRPEVGFTLRIPQTGNPFLGDRALRSHPTTYTVAAGDTIHSIACRFGDVHPEAIAQANGLSAPYTLSPGQTLNIP